MSVYIVRRLILLVPVIAGITLFSYSITRLIPGDVVAIMLGNYYSEGVAEVLRHQMGLDRPVLYGYVDWMSKAVRGDLGQSIRSGHRVTDLLAQRIPISVSLGGLSLIVSLALGIPLGIVAAVHRYRLAGYLCNSIALIGISTPSYWLSFLLIFVFSVTLKWLPPSGYVDFSSNPALWFQLMTMPAVTLGLICAAGVMRITRSSVLEVLSEQYVQTARSKGIWESRVIVKHVLRNAAIPILTVVGVNLGYLIGSVVVVELIFAVPGLGRLALTGINQRDYPVVQGVVLIMTLMFVLINLIVDLMYSFIDPRIRYE